MGGGIARELARADLKLKPAEYVALMVIAGIGVGAVSWYFGGRSILFALIGVLIGMMLPRILCETPASQPVSPLQRATSRYAQPDGEWFTGWLFNHAGYGGDQQGATSAYL